MLIGAALATLLFAPAAWLAQAVAQASAGRFLLSDASGSVWTGSAVPVLTGGKDSRDAMTLPGRLSWKIRPSLRQGFALELRAQQDCCLNDWLRVRFEPGFGRWRLVLPASSGAIGHWPAAWLIGLGTPWNTLQLGGSVGVSSPGLTIDSALGRVRFAGRVEIELLGISSRLSTLPTLGSYRVAVSGQGSGSEAAQLTLSTLDGSLRLSGSGQWSAGRLKFRGEARANEGSETMLNNLLNIIGRRQGALSIISIG